MKTHYKSMSTLNAIKTDIFNRTLKLESAHNRSELNSIYSYGLCGCRVLAFDDLNVESL